MCVIFLKFWAAGRMRKFACSWHLYRNGDWQNQVSTEIYASEKLPWVWGLDWATQTPGKCPAAGTYNSRTAKAGGNRQLLSEDVTLCWGVQFPKEGLDLRDGHTWLGSDTRMGSKGKKQTGSQALWSCSFLIFSLQIRGKWFICHNLLPLLEFSFHEWSA